MPIELTRARWEQLCDVQWELNQRIDYTPDLEQFGQVERWAVVDDKGDCDDYMLTKRQELIAKGWPVDCLLPATCDTETGGLHAVLVVVTDRGDYVLDNRYEKVMPWAELPYYNWSRLDYASGQWVSVG